jgi:hypothetical protein
MLITGSDCSAECLFPQDAECLQSSVNPDPDSCLRQHALPYGRATAPLEPLEQKHKC